MARERLTIRYKGNPEGVNPLVGLLRSQGLKVSQNPSLNLPMGGQQWMIRRDIVEVYGTLIDVKARSEARTRVETAIGEFRRRYAADAEISIEH